MRDLPPHPSRLVCCPPPPASSPRRVAWVHDMASSHVRLAACVFACCLSSGFCPQLAGVPAPRPSLVDTRLPRTFSLPPLCCVGAECVQQGQVRAEAADHGPQSRCRRRRQACWWCVCPPPIHPPPSPPPCSSPPCIPPTPAISTRVLSRDLLQRSRKRSTPALCTTSCRPDRLPPGRTRAMGCVHAFIACMCAIMHLSFIRPAMKSFLWCSQLHFACNWVATR